ncbi:MAG: putative peptidoglycan glycosyltransferase FtsW [Armatimonadota bacterium]|jgi:cell division protein FtsW
MDDGLLLNVLMLTVLGVFLVYTASFLSAGRLSGSGEMGDPHKFLKTQGLYAACGIVLMLLLSLLPPRCFHAVARPGLLVALGLLVAVLIWGTSQGGSRRWLQLGPVLFQPSEIAKMALVLYLARFLGDRWHEVRSFSICIRAVIITGAVCVLVALEPDLGGAVMLLLIGLGMLFLAGARLWQVGLFGIGSAAAAVLYASFHPYMKARIDGWLHPLEHVQGAGYHVIRVLVALASGGVFGTGLGEGTQKCYLPARHTDSIYCVLGEEFGIIGCAALLVLLCIFARRGLQIARHAPNRFSQLAAGGLVVAICLQALINLGVSTGCLPVTGTTLPFISGGGSSLMMVLMSAGIILSTSRLRQAGGRARKGAVQTGGGR